MCGIFAVYQPLSAISEHTVNRALEAINHRGPDGKGIYISPSGTVALGHTRLATVGIATGAQPISNEDNRVHMIVNGEFYDFERIRSELQAKGYKFKTTGDSEIALHLYEEYGIDCLKHLRGEFALVIWDERKQQLFVARDRFGIKPIVYHLSNGTLHLASEAKALFAAGIAANWDEESFFHSANMQYVLPDRTLFSGIKQLPPGHFLLARGSDVIVERYWDLDYGVNEDAFAGSAACNEESLIAEFGAKLEDAVRVRLRAEAPVCAHLSGGLDSSAVVGLAMKHHSKPLKCYSISFEEESYDELTIAKEMAEFAGADFEPIFVSQRQLVECLPDAVYYSEGFAVNGHLPAKYILNQTIRKGGYKVALTGEGADEVVAGYPHLRSDLFKSDGRQNLLANLHATNKASAGIMLQHGQSLSLAAVEEKLGYVPGFLEAKGTLGFKLCSVLTDQFKGQFAGRDAYRELIDCFDVDGQLTGRNRVNQSLYLWSKTALVNYILRTLGDGMEMASSVEGRLPFLDHHLFEFVRKLPLSLKIKGTTEKYVLREAVKPVISKTIYERQKHPFVAPPLSRFSNSEADAVLQDVLRSKNFQSVPYFDQKKVIALLDSLPEMKPEDRSAVDPVLMTAMSAAALHERYKL
ncbi:MAG: asparagine synthase (glutamine-hydrolyzing) [Candidatus Obscuribacterales bacterium]